MPSYDGEIPTKESDSNYDYLFAGWTPNVVKATKPATYVATFSSEEITYTIDFDLNGGTSNSYNGPIEIKTLSNDVFFFDCVKEGWSFRGWEYQNEKIFDEKGNQLKNVTLVDNMVFKAIYTQTVKLTIVSNISEAGITTGEGEYPYNTYVDVSATPNQGYRFIGWYYQGTLLSNTTEYKYMMWDQDITLEARFELDYFTMHVYSNSEEHGLVLLRSNSNLDYLPEYQEQRRYTSDVTIAAYSKTDVRFLGWYDENNQLVTTNAVYSFVMPNHDYTLQAKWNYFKIHYNLNGGINSENNPEYFDIDDNEIILKGSDIQRYGTTPSGNYIRFVPESFQQVAPVEMYRAKEKLLYRFISEVPVFTYDNQQTLSLNSCNIVIPDIDGLEMKYILAILNSSVAAYFVTKKFNSIKLLRSHIEQIPIPIVSKDIQVAIVKKVDRIMNSSENISGLYEDLDGDIMALYGLDVDQIETIQTALSGKNLFLKEN